MSLQPHAQKYSQLAVDFIAKPLILLFSISLLINTYQISENIATTWDTFKFANSDWPDTAAMSLMVQRGELFVQHAQFIGGGTIFGLFPPLFYFVASAVNFFIGDMFAAMFVISIVLQLLVTYYVVRDWKFPVEAAIIVLLLNFNPFTMHMFPFVLRLREMFAVLFLIFMVKNTFKLKPLHNLAIFGAIMVLSQPLVALIGIAAYLAMNFDSKRIHIKKEFLFVAAALALLFVITYNQHFLLRAACSDSMPTYRCATTLIVVFSNPLYLSMLFLVPAPFFLLRSKSHFVRLAWTALICGFLFLMVLSNFPELFWQLVLPFKEDLCVHVVFSFFVLFACFPPKEPPKLPVLHLLYFILAFQLFFSGVLSINGLKSPELTPNLAPVMYPENGSRVIAFDVSLWDQQKQILVEGFEAGYPSKAYLLDRNYSLYYSPMQQYYDTENLLPPIYSLLNSIALRNTSACRVAVSTLSDKADYLYVDLFSTAYSSNSWSGGIVDSFYDRNFLDSCGIAIAVENPKEYPSLLYRLNSG